MLGLLKKWENRNDSVASVFRANARKNKNKPAFMMDDKRITFQEVRD
jgi:acyl-CoA synthetase (AMP-forming)/AMP-acid ligase II